jgi:hypothetical protein
MMFEKNVLNETRKFVALEFAISSTIQQNRPIGCLPDLRNSIKA